MPVAVREAKLVDYQPKLTLSGAVAARSLVNVSFRVNGQVVERLVDIGQHVEKGSFWPASTMLNSAPICALRRLPWTPQKRSSCRPTPISSASRRC
ncbi:efflux RND transporter periplasmic adaptor subunit [Brucella abortus]|nr:efflux RND transporter periplasmic adaptor subunit [Brucella abortus]